MYRFKEIQGKDNFERLELVNVMDIFYLQHKKPFFKDIVKFDFGYTLVFTDGVNDFVSIDHPSRLWGKNFIPIKNNEEISYIHNDKVKMSLDIFNNNENVIDNLNDLEEKIENYLCSNYYNKISYRTVYNKFTIKEFDNTFTVFKLLSETKSIRNTVKIQNLIKIDKDLINKKDLNLIVDIINNFTNQKTSDAEKNNSYLKNIIKLLLKSFELKYSNKNKFETFYIPKTDGTKREINSPIEEIRPILKSQSKKLNAILEYRISKYNIEDNIIAYRDGKSIKNNADYHKENDTIIKFDVSKFFDNCHFDYWKENLFFILNDNKNLMKRFEKEMEGFLFRKDNKGLYMGSPLSPAASNLIVVPVMRYIKNVISKFKSDIKVSIYSDDITFSSKEINDEFNPSRLKNLVNHAFEIYNLDFKIKEEKSLVMKNRKRKVTGLSINQHNQVTISQRRYRELRTILHLLSNGMEFKDIKGFDNEIELTSLINYYLDVDMTGKISRLINKYEKTFNELKSFESGEK
ncbi:RNA-directed DNA polymerase [Staphylococcus phage Machias]|nr:RNA-directed DNA polymerase [Staphylococcus phage Machias]